MSVACSRGGSSRGCGPVGAAARGLGSSFDPFDDAMAKRTGAYFDTPNPVALYTCSIRSLPMRPSTSLWTGNNT